MFKIGVMVESFKQGLRKGLEAAAELGADGVQIYGSEGESHYEKLDKAARASLLSQAKGLKLEFSAVCGDFGGEAFHNADGNPARIEKSKRVVEMALDLGCKVITTHAGCIPADPSVARHAVMSRAFEQLGRFAYEHGAVFAIETGPEKAETLAAFIKNLDIPSGVGVNFDPANLAMVCREDVVKAAGILAPWTVHTHAKDGVNLRPFDPEGFYGPRHLHCVNWDEFFKEVQLGEGSVPFKEYLTALRACGYSGYLTVEREVGAAPCADIALAVEFLKRTMATL